MRALLLLPLLAIVVSACMAPRVTPSRPDPRYARVIAMAAEQVRRCYRSPRVRHEARGIVTVLAVAYGPDGALATLPRVVVQRGITDANAADASRMAEAAALAVIRCSPLRLPPEQYRGGWDAFELTFSPKAVA